MAAVRTASQIKPLLHTCVLDLAENVGKHIQTDKASAAYIWKMCEGIVVLTHLLQVFLYVCKGKDITPDYANVVIVVFSSPQVVKLGAKSKTRIVFLSQLLCLCRGKDIKPDYANVASVVFSSPQVAKVGINEDQAVEKHGDVDIFTSTFS